MVFSAERFLIIEMPNNKSENNEHRRAYTLMSQEDVANGKKSHWTELEVTATIRNLSPKLWQLNFLTALFLNDNNLTRIPPEIAKLTSLRHLDVSSNKLRSLPVEMGDMVTLRELLLCNNNLRVLPNELGKLFQLQSLVLQGNPLPPELLNLLGEANGTTKLLTYMLDNLAGEYTVNMVVLWCQSLNLTWLRYYVLFCTASTIYFKSYHSFSLLQYCFRYYNQNRAI